MFSVILTSIALTNNEYCKRQSNDRLRKYGSKSSFRKMYDKHKTYTDQ